jgi:transposase InsO family protein
MVAQGFINQGYPVERVLTCCRLAKSSYYYRARQGRRGRTPSTHTLTRAGQWVSNEQVVEEIKELLDRRFVDYGYIKVTWWLRYHKSYQINFKKVYRLMKEEKLLYPQRLRSRFPRNWADWQGPQIQDPLSYWQFDIKYVYIHGQRRNALLLTVLDVPSRWVMGHYLGWNIRKEQVRELFIRILSQYGNLPEQITVRSDNGSQFVARTVREYIAEMKITQEFTRPATPQQDGHVEAWHSIVEGSICQRLELGDLAEAKATFQDFIAFYNTERIHSGIGYKSPLQYLTELGIELTLTDQPNNQQPQPSKVEYLSSL